MTASTSTSPVTPTPNTYPDQLAAGPDPSAEAGEFARAWSVRELAARLGVSAQTIYDLRSQGRGPRGFRIGRELRFRQAEVAAWLARLEDQDAQRHPVREPR